ncbi:hypothetical protein HDU84_001112, partial [Entophlyctis sp. JEL0112]
LQICLQIRLTSGTNLGSLKTVATKVRIRGAQSTLFQAWAAPSTSAAATADAEDTTGFEMPRAAFT